MNEDKKIRLDDLRKRLQARMKYRDPDLALRALISGWIHHPKFKSPTRQTFAIRIREDGFAWLKVEEIASFEAYIGVPVW